MKTRTQKVKLNMFFSLLQQCVSLVCGLILPRLMIGTFGSEANGAVGSITTFLSYIVLLEGGIGAVTRSALYKAFASGSEDQVSAVVNETKRFYRRIAFIFLAYILVIACFFKQISHTTVFDDSYSFWLVIVIALSTFAEYFIGVTYSLLLQADQAEYIPSIIRTVATVFNTIAVIFLIRAGCDLLTVKLVSSIVFVLRPIVLAVYVRKHYTLTKTTAKEKLLTQKGAAIGQHIAWTLHNNTDVTVLTVFKGLSFVSVYSVYSMVINQLQNLLNAVTAGMEAVFGNMLANNEKEKLAKVFGYYETLLSMIGVTAFSTAAVMIIPFVRLYTAGITDIEYIQPAFSTALIIASLLYCVRTPYSCVIIAAGHFRQTQYAAYGEALINIVLSIILVKQYGLIGVAIGTVAATLFRFIYYMVYLKKNILMKPLKSYGKRALVDSGLFVTVYVFGNFLIQQFSMDNYFKWFLVGVLLALGAGTLALGANSIFYRTDVSAILAKGFGKIRLRKE